MTEDPRPPLGTIELSGQQKALVLALADGLDYAHAAERIGVRTSTAKNYLSYLSLVLRTRRIAGVVGTAVRLGVVVPPPSDRVELVTRQKRMVSLLAAGYSGPEIASFERRPPLDVRVELGELAERFSAVTHAHLVWRAAGCGLELSPVAEVGR